MKGITYDVRNASGAVSNQPGIILAQFMNTNLCQLTTNTFQCFDISLTNGLNTITLHATDWAGNVANTNIAITLNFSGVTNPPAISVFWPQNGDTITGTAFTLRGSLNEFTASLTAQIIASDGSTNTLSGLVERNGFYWVENAYLPPGTNYLTLTAVNAAGRISTTNLTINVLNLALTIDDFSDQLGSLPRNVVAAVTGTINLTNYTLWVNGIQATQDGQGNWEADSVPMGSGGTAVVEARAIPQTPSAPNGQGTGTVGPTDGTPSNPTAAGSIAAQIQLDQPTIIYMSRCNFSWSAPGTGGSLNWTHEGGGSGNYHYWDGDWDAQYEVNYAFTWPVADELGDTSQVYVVYSDSLGNESSGDWTWVTALEVETAAGFALETVQGNGTTTEYNGSQISTQTTASCMTMQTGGKGGSASQMIAGLYVWAGQDGGKFGIGIETSSADYQIGVTLPSSAVTVMGQSPGSDGWLYVSVPANQTIDVTPHATVPRNEYYVGGNAYAPTLTANGYDLSQTNPTFCVGQQITFNLSCPGLPMTNVLCSWALGGNFVNVSSAPNSAGCVAYTTNYSLLRGTTNTYCQCWYFSGGGTTVNAGFSVFAGGRSLSAAAMGTFSIYSPKITSLVPSTNVAIFLETNDAPNIYLGVGDSLGVVGSMQWNLFVDVYTTFTGKGFYAQLVNQRYSWDEPYLFTSLNHNDTTSGGYWLDNNYPYKFAGPYPVVGKVTNMNWIFGDGPGITGPLYSFADCSNAFMTYVCFQPNGGIPITIGRVDWGWHGKTVLSNGLWSLTVSNIIAPTLNATDNSFPQWQQVYNNRQ